MKTRISQVKAVLLTEWIPESPDNPYRHKRENQTCTFRGDPFQAHTRTYQDYHCGSIQYCSSSYQDIPGLSLWQHTVLLKLIPGHTRTITVAAYSTAQAHTRTYQDYHCGSIQYCSSSYQDIPGLSLWQYTVLLKLIPGHTRTITVAAYSTYCSPLNRNVKVCTH